MQRAQSSDKIGEYNNLIDIKLEEYQNYLQDIFQKQQNKSK